MNYNLTTLDMHNGISQVYSIKPEEFISIQRVIQGWNDNLKYNIICPPPFQRKVFGIPSFRPSVPPQEVGILCMELLLQFFSDCFETLQVFRSWSEDVHIVLATSSDYLLSFFSQNKLLRPKLMDTRYLVCAFPPTVLCQFLWNFTGV